MRAGKPRRHDELRRDDGNPVEPAAARTSFSSLRWWWICGLALRGPGDFFGTRQAGLPTFRSIDLVRDKEMLDTARTEATAWLRSAAPTPAALTTMLQAWEQRFRLVAIG